MTDKKWSFSNLSTLTHIPSGYSITLKSGLWSEPLDIEPFGGESLDAIEKVSLLRLGLEYAEQYSHLAKATTGKIPEKKTRTTPKNGRKVLSLKRA